LQLQFKGFTVVQAISSFYHFSGIISILIEFFFLLKKKRVGSMHLGLFFVRQCFTLHFGLHAPCLDEKNV